MSTNAAAATLTSANSIDSNNNNNFPDAPHNSPIKPYPPAWGKALSAQGKSSMIKSIQISDFTTSNRP